ncbi:MAG: carbohydrate kinase family protein [Candidatus Brocadiia bacterium]
MKSAQPTPARPLVACIGEILWDCFPDRKVLGGAPLNCGYMAQCMGARALPISRVGDDPDGRAILQVMKDKRLDTSCVQVDPVHPTGIVRVAVSAQGEPAYTIVEDAAYDFLAWEEKLAGPLARCDAVCFGTLAQRNPAGRAGILRMIDRAQKALKVFDVNLRQNFFSREILAGGFKRAQVVKLNDGELEVLKDLFASDFAGGIGGFMERYGIELMAVTRGADGCTICRGGEEVGVPGLKVAVADTVGAGDAFTASLMISCLKRLPPAEIGREANLWGAYVATQCGGTPEVRQDAIARLRQL